MAQHDMDVANQTFTATRADMNAALQALVSNNSGATAPATTFAYQWWADTTSGILKQRNAANSAWVNVLTMATGVPTGAVAAGAITSSGLTQTTGRLLGRTTASTGAVEEITAGSALIFSSGNLDVANAGITAAKLSGAQTGTAPIYGARAWCVFDGSLTGTNAPTAGGNVSSILRNGTGDYTVTLATAMPDVNYSIQCMARPQAGSNIFAHEAEAAAFTRTTTQFRIVLRNTGASVQDSAIVSLSVFR